MIQKCYKLSGLPFMRSSESVEVPSPEKPKLSSASTVLVFGNNEELLMVSN